MRLILAIWCCIAACGVVPPDTPTSLLPRVGSVASSASPAAERPLTITALRVGQGDAVVVETPDGTTILIDGGPPESGVILPDPDLSIATHYDLDHIAGLVEWMLGPDRRPETLDDRHPTLGCLDRGEEPTKNATWSLTTYLTLRRPCHRVVAPGYSMKLGDVSIDMLATNGCFADGTCRTLETSDENGHGIVLRITYGDFTYLHMGDLPGGGGRPPYQTVDLESTIAPLAGDIDVLFVGHHGSKTSSNENFLAATHPEVAIISYGAGNDHGHPHREVLDRLAQHDIEVYTTRNHDIQIVTYGAGYSIGATTDEGQ